MEKKKQYQMPQKGPNKTSKSKILGRLSGDFPGVCSTYSSKIFIKFITESPASLRSIFSKFFKACFKDFLNIKGHFCHPFQ